MTTLDYATAYETRFRHRRLRRTLLGLAAVFISAVPLAFVLVPGSAGPSAAEAQSRPW